MGLQDHIGQFLLLWIVVQTEYGRKLDDLALPQVFPYKHATNGS